MEGATHTVVVSMAVCVDVAAGHGERTVFSDRNASTDQYEAEAMVGGV